jgi:hypothetical protein
MKLSRVTLAYIVTCSFRWRHALRHCREHKLGRAARCLDAYLRLLQPATGPFKH